VQVAMLGTASAATDDVDEVKATSESDGSSLAPSKKVRYFSNFYRQAEPDEVFVGGRLKELDTDHQRIHSQHQSTQYDNHRPYLTPPTSPFPPLTYALFNPSLAAVCSRYRLVRGTTVTSLPPSV